MTIDPLETETSLDVALTKYGLKGKAKSRAIAAIDRLLGNAIEWINLFVERNTEKRRGIISTEKNVTEAVRRAIIKQIDAGEPLVGYLIEQHLKETYFKLNNKAAVVQEAISELKRQPPTESLSQTASSSVSETLDEDWLASFDSYAERATTEQMRQLLGRILAGEINKPGAFSRTTIRVAAELDQVTAKEFAEIAKLRQDGSIPREGGPTELPTLLNLEAAGLISYSPTLKSTFAAPGDTTDIILFPYALRVKLKVAGTSWAVPCCVLTKPGRELAELIPNDALSALEKLVSTASEQLRSAVIYKLTKQPDGRLMLETAPFRTLILEADSGRQMTPFG